MQSARAEERRQWTPLIEELPGRESLTGLFLIVDIRRGIGEQDEQLIDWAEAAGWQVHVLLAKSDKLNQRERAAALKEAQALCGTRATVQVFSAHGQNRRATGPEAPDPDAGERLFFLSHLMVRRRFGGVFLRGRQPSKRKPRCFTTGARLTRHRSREPGYPLREGSGERFYALRC